MTATNPDHAVPVPNRGALLGPSRQDWQLVLAGGGSTDDPEGSQVLREVQEAAAGDPDIHVLLLHRLPHIA